MATRRPKRDSAPDEVAAPRKPVAPSKVAGSTATRAGRGTAVPGRTPRTAVLVVGMHRSGTSAVTRVLNLLGCDLPKTLMAPGPTNESGHWESDAFYDLNNRILESAGSYWHDWLELNPGWFQSPKADEFRDEALATLKAEFGSSRLFVFKDPRICRLVPFWLDVLAQAGVRPLVLSPVRNPLEVAASLQNRSGFDPSLGHLLWLRHVLDAEFASRGASRFFTGYDRVLSNWGRVAEDAQNALGIKWPRLSDRTAAEIDYFLSDRHRHHSESRERVVDNPALSSWLRDSFRVLSNWAQSGEKPQDHATLDRIRQEFNAAAPAFGRLVFAGRQAADDARRFERGLAEANTRLATLQSDYETVAADFTQIRHRLAETQSALAQRQLETEETSADLSAARERLSASAVEIATLTRLLQQKEAEAAGSSAEFNRLQQELYAERTRAQGEKAAEVFSLTEALRQLQTNRDEQAQRADQGEHRAVRLSHDVNDLRQNAGIEFGRVILAMIALPPAWDLLPARYRLKRQMALLKRSGLFDAEWYLGRYEDIAKAGIDPMLHYIEHGAREGREPNGALARSGSSAPNGKTPVDM